jgi:hypothetical protein
MPHPAADCRNIHKLEALAVKILKLITESPMNMRVELQEYCPAYFYPPLISIIGQ